MVILRDLLLAEKASLLRERRPNLEDLTLPGNLSAEDEGRFVHDQLVAVHLRKHENQKLRKIEAALDRLATGDYGFCETCEEPIARKRLLAVPWADHCVPCQEEVQERTPPGSRLGLAA